jgi:hypothetical protein
MGRVVLVVLVMGCTKPAATSPPPETTVTAVAEPISPQLAKLQWSAQSSDGRVTIRQTARALDACEVSSRGGSVTWTIQQCLSDSLAMHFVSPDGARLLVLDTLPRTGTGADGWALAEVAVLFERGVALSRTSAGAMVTDASKLARFAAHFAWARGTGGLEGSAEPTLTADGLAVSLTSADGQTFRLGFDGTGFPPPATLARTAEARPPPTARPLAFQLQPTAAPAHFDTCAAGVAEVERAERTVREIESAPQPANPCLASLNSGSFDSASAEYARCMAAQNAPSGGAERLAGARATLARAQDQLRRAKADGCR